MRVVDDAVENGVGDGRLADHVVPFVDWHLGGDQSRLSAIAFLADFQEVEALAIDFFSAMDKAWQRHDPRREP